MSSKKDKKAAKKAKLEEDQLGFEFVADAAAVKSYSLLMNCA